MDLIVFVWRWAADNEITEFWRLSGQSVQSTWKRICCGVLPLGVRSWREFCLAFNKLQMTYFYFYSYILRGVMVKAPACGAA
jgi:hypothetical protein